MSELPEIQPIRTILAATDLSEASRPAVHTAAWLARALGAEFHLVHALGDALDPRLSFPDEAFAEKLYQQAVDDLQRVAERMPGGAETAVRVEVRRGNPVDVILEDIRAVGADLLVVGTHGRSGLEYLELGSVAEHLATNAPVDLLLVRAECGGFTRPLVGATGSEASRRAAARALQVARAVGAAKVDLCSAFSLPMGWDQFAGGLEKHAERMREVQEAEVAPARRDLEAAGLLGEVVLEQGRPARVLLETATRLGNDVVFLGSHNRPRWTAMLLGDTARVLAHRLPCATWLVRELPPEHPVLDTLQRLLGLKR